MSELSWEESYISQLRKLVGHKKLFIRLFVRLFKKKGEEFFSLREREKIDGGCQQVDPIGNQRNKKC